MPGNARSLLAMALIIRSLQPADKSDWQHLWKSYLDFYETELSADTYTTTFDRLIGPDTNEFRCLLAVDNDRPVGLAHFLSHRHCWHQQNVFHLQDLFVDASARGQGVGRKLIETIYSIANDEQAPDVYWMTHNDNHTARRLYDHMAHKVDFIKYQR